MMTGLNSYKLFNLGEYNNPGVKRCVGCKKIILTSDCVRLRCLFMDQLSKTRAELIRCYNVVCCTCVIDSMNIYNSRNEIFSCFYAGLGGTFIYNHHETSRFTWICQSHGLLKQYIEHFIKKLVLIKYLSMKDDDNDGYNDVLNVIPRKRKRKRKDSDFDLNNNTSVVHYWLPKDVSKIIEYMSIYLALDLTNIRYIAKLDDVYCPGKINFLKEISNGILG